MLSTKTVVVLGAAYGGPRAAQVLVAGLPAGWRVLLIDRNSPDIQITSTFYPAYLYSLGTNIRRATVASIGTNSITLSKAFPEIGLPTREVSYEFLVYALGSHLPPPLNLWGDGQTIDLQRRHWLPAYKGMKSEGIAWLKAHQRVVESSPTVLVVGGGALGIQFATDIATVHSSKKVTLLHSRKRLLPRFDEAMHTEVLAVLESMDNIDVILGERLDLPSLEEPGKTNKQGQRIVYTVTGREIAADLVLLCTGQKPNTGLLKKLDPTTINPDDSLAHVLRTMQLGVLPPPGATSINRLHKTIAKGSLPDSLSSSPISQCSTAKSVKGEEKTPYPHIFVIGDAADAFGAIAAGHNAYYQGEVAARNILRLINKSKEPLEHYKPGPPMIKVSLGLGKAVSQSGSVVERRDGDPDDLHAATMWPLYGIPIVNDDQMYE